MERFHRENIYSKALTFLLSVGETGFRVFGIEAYSYVGRVRR
jgi:hypothetical protein